MDSAQSIKEKYGYGFEIDVRVMPLSEEKIKEIYKANNLEKNTKVSMENIQQLLDNLKKGKYISE